MGNQQQTHFAEPPPSSLGKSLVAFLRRSKPAVVSGWQAALRDTPQAQLAGWPALRDHVPRLVDSLASMTETLCAGQLAAAPQDLADAIACERLREGYAAEALIHEFAVLRDCIVRQWIESAPRHLGAGVRVLNLALDRQLGSALERYVTVQNRTLQALDNVAAGTWGGIDLQECLQHLLGLIYDTCAAVDTAAILLVDGDQLRVRASVGLEQEVVDRVCIPIGRGFAGLVASTAAPVCLDAAGIERIVLSPVLRTRGLQGLYGVPLIQEGVVIGVSHIGSLRVAQFSEQDTQLFAAMTHRATAGIARHLLQQALMEHNAQLTQAKHLAEQIVGVVSHDLRTPITAISINTESLLRQHPTTHARASLERIRQSTRRADRMITDLLDLTRARMGTGVPVRPAPMNLCAVATQVVQELRQVHPQHVFALQTHGEMLGNWDAERLAQVFSNLLHNAAKYSTLDAPITCALTSCDSAVRISVHNVHSAGKAITPESMEHLFEPMWRGDGARGNGEGVGLGLFIVETIARAHGGSCAVVSNDAEGTTFVVTLPRRTL